MQPAKEEEFDRLYGLHEPQVMRYLFGMLGDPELAADAAQETWIRYLHYVERPRPRYDVTLLLAVAHNVARDIRRRQPHRVQPQDAKDGANDCIRMAWLVSALPDDERDVMHSALGLRLEDIRPRSVSACRP
ncbi:MAG: sigma factor [Thermaerobacter sp.]|nr:sigma factor [Thermaerobacter sp.]